MQLTRKIRIKINQECKDYLDFASEQCRLIYNFALAEKIKYYQDHKKTLSMYEQKKQLPELKEKYPKYKKVYSKCLTAMYFRLDNAYTRFFKKISNFPTFKRKNVFVSQEYPGESIKKIDDYRFKLSTGGTNPNFIVRTYKKIPDKYGTVIIKKRKNLYFACFKTEEKEKDFEDNKEILAIDLGIKTLVMAASTKQSFVEVAKFSHYTRHLDKIRSKRDKCKKGSRKWIKYNVLLQNRLNKYQNRVNDYMHKSSYWISSKRLESTIVVGKLNLEKMKTEKSWFNRVILNEWRVKRFVKMLSYKCVRYGKRLVEIDEAYTTRECSNCGKHKKLALKDRVYKCTCGLEINRDKNSAINILKKYCMANAIKVSDTLIRFTSVNNLHIDSFVYM